VVAEAGHGLGLALHALEPRLVQALGLDHGDGNVTVEASVMRQVDALAPALAEEALDPVAAGGEGGGAGRDAGGGPAYRQGRRARRLRRRGLRLAGAISHSEKRPGVQVFGIYREDAPGQLADSIPLSRCNGRLRVVEKSINLALDSFRGHQMSRSS